MRTQAANDKWVLLGLGGAESVGGVSLRRGSNGPTNSPAVSRSDRSFTAAGCAVANVSQRGDREAENSSMNILACAGSSLLLPLL